MTTNNYEKCENSTLDKAVAELMGWKVGGYYGRNDLYYQESATPELVMLVAEWHPSTNLEQAKDVVDKMPLNGWQVNIDYPAGNQSLPRAICIAALMAKESGSR